MNILAHNSTFNDCLTKKNVFARVKDSEIGITKVWVFKMRNQDIFCDVIGGSF